MRDVMESRWRPGLAPKFFTRNGANGDDVRTNVAVEYRKEHANRKVTQEKTIFSKRAIASDVPSLAVKVSYKSLMRSLCPDAA